MHTILECKLENGCTQAVIQGKETVIHMHQFNAVSSDIVGMP